MRSSGVSMNISSEMADLTLLSALKSDSIFPFTKSFAAVSVAVFIESVAPIITLKETFSPALSSKSCCKTPTIGSQADREFERRGAFNESGIATLP